MVQRIVAAEQVADGWELRIGDTVAAHTTETDPVVALADLIDRLLSEYRPRAEEPSS